MKDSEIYWAAACFASDYTGSCNPDFAVLMLSGNSNFCRLAPIVREAGWKYTGDTVAVESFDFLHFMALKAEDDEALAESIRLRVNMQTSMIPINKLSDVQLGDKAK